MLHIICILTAALAAGSCAEYKVGLLLPDYSIYTPALKNVTSFAVAEPSESSVSISLVHQEYDGSVLSTTEAACTLLENNVSAVISVSSSSNTAIQADIFSPYNIPFISVLSTEPFLQNGKRDYLFLLSPSDMHQSSAIYDIIKFYKWTKFSILASADSYGMNGLIHLQHLVAAGSEIVLNNIQYFELDGSNYRMHLQNIKDSLSQIIVLNCGVEHGKSVLELAKTMGLMNNGFVWIVTHAITTQPEVISYDGAYPSFYDGLIGIIPSIEKGDAYNTFKDDYVINNGYPISDLSDLALMTYDAVNMVHTALEYAETHNALVQQPNVSCKANIPWEDGIMVYDALLSVSLDGVSGPIQFTVDRKSTRLSYDILNFKEVGFVSVGTWNTSSGLTIDGKLIFLGGETTAPSALSVSLSGRHLRFGIVEEPPLAFKVDSSNCTDNYANPDCWYGFCPELNKKLSEDLNFTYEYVEPDDNKYGGYDPDDKSWNGMIGDMLDGKIDVIATGLAVNSERSKDITFSYSFTEDSATSILKGNTGTQNMFFFMSPFETNVWLLILGIGLAFTFLVNLFDKLSPFGMYGGKIHAMQTCSCANCETRRDTIRKFGGKLSEAKEFECIIDKVEDEDSMDTVSLYNSSWIVSTGFVGQSAEQLPRCPSGRLLLFSWWFFVMIIVAMYTANLTAFLTLKRVSASINKIDDLLDQSAYKWGVIADRNTESRLLNHVDSTYAEVVNGGVKLNSLEEAMEKVRNGDFVFIDEGSVLDYNFRDDCDMMQISIDMQSNEWGYGLHKNSPYEFLINTMFLKYREEEYFTELKKTWYGGDATCTATSVGSDTPFSTATLLGLFYILGMAVVICFIMVILESFYVAHIDKQIVPKMSFAAAYRRRLKLKFYDILHDWFGKRGNMSKGYEVKTDSEL